MADDGSQSTCKLSTAVDFVMRDDMPMASTEKMNKSFLDEYNSQDAHPQVLDQDRWPGRQLSDSARVRAHLRPSHRHVPCHFRPARCECWSSVAARE